MRKKLNTLARAAPALLLLAALAACGWELRPSDKELGLNQQQARGRRLYDANCHLCHEPYGERERRGPSLMNMWAKEAMFNDRPLTEENVRRLVREGIPAEPGERRDRMPAFDTNALSEQQLDDLMEYLKTLPAGGIVQ